MIKKSVIALLLLALVASCFSYHASAIDEVMENAADPTHVDHRAGVTDDDIMNAHMEDPDDEIRMHDYRTELMHLRERIHELESNPEDFDEDEKEHLINRAKILEDFDEKNNEHHEEINQLMERLAQIKLSESKGQDL